MPTKILGKIHLEIVVYRIPHSETVPENQNEKYLRPTYPLHDDQQKIEKNPVKNM